jgi:hypothetical protein
MIIDQHAIAGEYKDQRHRAAHRRTTPAAALRVHLSGILRNDFLCPFHRGYHLCRIFLAFQHTVRQTDLLHQLSLDEQFCV